MHVTTRQQKLGLCAQISLVCKNVIIRVHFYSNNKRNCVHELIYYEIIHATIINTLVYRLTCPMHLEGAVIIIREI